MNSCLQCRIEFLEHVHFLVEGVFTGIKCIENMDNVYQISCIYNECTTYIHIMYSSQQETITFNNLNSHMVIYVIIIIIIMFIHLLHTTYNVEF